MPDNATSQFMETVNIFGKIFDHLSLVCTAIKIKEKWVSIYTCLMLSSSEDARIEPTTVKAGLELIAFSMPYPREAFETIFKEIQSGSLSVNVGSDSYQLFLNRAAASLKTQDSGGSRLHFSNVWRPQRQFSPNQDTFQPTVVLQTSGDRFYELFSYDDNERISRALRAHRPPYNGLIGLLRFLGCRNLPNSSSDEGLIEVKAILPFRTTIQEDQVFVDCPISLAPEVSVLFFFSGHESTTVTYSERFPISTGANWASVPFRIDWPSNASQAEAHVLYNDQEVEVITVRHWASGANWRVTVDSYFDPESKLLKEALRGENQSLKENQRSELFEQAVVRLLSLGGIAATWHGAIRLSGKPDLAAYCEVHGRRIVLIGECTLENPNAKLSSLRSRMDALLELVGNSAELLPVVFTACDPVPSDYSDAAKANIALAGRKEIGWILSLVEKNAGVSAIIKQIENIKTAHEFPEVSRWAERF